MWNARLCPLAFLGASMAACHGPPTVIDPPDGSAGTIGQSGSGGSGMVGTAGGGGSGNVAGGGGAAGQTGTGGGTGATGGGSGTGGSPGVGGSAGASGSTSTGGGAGNGNAGAGGLGGTGALGGSGGSSGDCGVRPPLGPSCSGLANDCGPGNDENCCETRCVPGGTFTLGRGACDSDDSVCSSSRVCGSGTNEVECTDFEAPAVAADISPYWLDRFEVTVGRYRKFVDAIVAGWRPTPGAGKHGYLDGLDLGWVDGWPFPWTTKAELDAALACNATFGSWTPAPGANETKPITCPTWYMAYAFCIWDGGFLPTEAEWELAASGGEERVYPWSEPASDTSIDSSHACYEGCGIWQPVGSFLMGDGKWGHADLGGNVMEWVLDGLVIPYPTDPCNDCTTSAPLTFGLRGGSFQSSRHEVRAAGRVGDAVHSLLPYGGMRCARAAR